MSVESQCAVCFNEKADLIEFLPCRHKAICAVCCSQLALSWFLQRPVAGRTAALSCPICRAAVKYIYNTALNALFATASQTPAAQQAAFKTFETAIKKAALPVASPWDFIGSIFREHLVFPDRLILLTVDQTESLLALAEARGIHEQIKNPLVALCIDPWDVDRTIGSFGVCYHGNLGDPPSNFLERLNYLQLHNYLPMAGF